MTCIYMHEQGMHINIHDCIILLVHKSSYTKILAFTQAKYVCQYTKNTSIQLVWKSGLAIVISKKVTYS